MCRQRLRMTSDAPAAAAGRTTTAGRDNSSVAASQDAFALLCGRPAGRSSADHPLSASERPPLVPLTFSSDAADSGWDGMGSSLDGAVASTVVAVWMSHAEMSWFNALKIP